MDTLEIPFPKYSTNLIIGVSNSGKSHFIKHVLSQTNFYFEQVPENIYIVHCNNQTPEYNLTLDEQDIKVHQIYIEEFDLNLVEPNSILVFEDVNKIYETIKIACNVATHHLPLLSCFIISQGVIHNKHFDLVKIVHRTIFCLGSTVTTKAADFIINYFYRDLEVKAYLKKVLLFAEKQGTQFLLKLNSIAARPSNFIACSHLLNNPFYLAYTFKNISESLIVPYQIKKNFIMSFENLNSIVDTVPENTFVILPLATVQKQTESIKSSPATSCTTKENWEKVAKLIYATIEEDMNIKRWKKCKQLARNILLCDEFCVTEDGVFLSLKSKPEERVVLFDFINDITRPSMKGETPRPEWKYYKNFILPLKLRGTSRQVFKNTLIVKRIK